MPLRSLSVLLLLATGLKAAEWNQWRGPQRNGTTDSLKAPKDWAKAKLEPKWTVKVGTGHSSPIVYNDKIYQFSRQDDQEVLHCVDRNGKPLWKKSYPAPYTMHPAARGHGKGPKATPIATKGKVVTFGISGILSCWDAKSGKNLWQKDYGKQYPKTSPLYGTAASPLVVDNLCIVPVGGHNKGALNAYDLESGKEQWSWKGDGPGYASPILVEMAGERQIVTQSQKFLLGVSAKNGSLLWKHPFTTAYDQNSVTTVVYEDLLIFSGYGQPTAAIRLKKEAEKIVLKVVWSNRDVPQYMSTGVLKGQWLFGMSHSGRGRIFCLDADSGRSVWTGKGRIGNNVSLVLAGETLILLTTNGKLIVTPASKEGYRPVAEFTVAKSPTWAHPVPWGNRILVKEKENLIALEIEE